MSDKFRRGRAGTDRYLKKHKGFGKSAGRKSRRPPVESRRPSRYDPDARY